jgi:hypothetical protein
VRDGGAIARCALPFAIIDFSDLPGVWADQVRRVALEHSEARITEAILKHGQVSAAPAMMSDSPAHAARMT